MTTTELEQAILELICNIYCEKYLGYIKVSETFSKNILEPKQHLGYKLQLGLNNADKPLSLAMEGSDLDFLNFIKTELRNRHLDLTEYFTAIQLYNADEK